MAFILSAERSGSTLLRYLLDTHPEIASPGEVGIGQLCNLFQLLVRRTAAAEEHPLTQDEIARLKTRDAVGMVMRQYAAQRNRRIWCDKTPDNIRYIDSLRDVFPEAGYICLYRHCLDVVYSCLRCSEYGFMPGLATYAARYPDNLVHAMANSWIDKTKILLNLEQQADVRTMRVCYEILVRTPKEQCAAVFSFLGVSPDSNVVDRAFTDQHHYGGGDRKINLETSVHTRSIGLGRHLLTLLPAETHDQIDKLLEQLSYEPLEAYVRGTR